MLERQHRELEQIIGSDLVIKRAYEALAQFNWTEEELDSYERELKRVWDNRAIEEYKIEQAKARLAEAEAKGKVEGLAEGLLIGRAEGKEAAEAERKIQLQENNITIARALLQAGVPVDTIISATGLTKQEINNLK